MMANKGKFQFFIVLFNLLQSYGAIRDYKNFTSIP